MPARKHRILIVDDHPDVRMGLRAFIEPTKDLMVCGEAQNAEQALADIDKLKPDLALVDVSLKDGLDGIELTRRVQKQFPTLRVLVLSLYEEQKYAANAMAAGAHGYVSKTASITEVLNAIRRTLRSEPAPRTTTAER